MELTSIQLKERIIKVGVSDCEYNHFRWWWIEETENFKYSDTDIICSTFKYAIFYAVLKALMWIHYSLPYFSKSSIDSTTDDFFEKTVVNCNCTLLAPLKDFSSILENVSSLEFGEFRCKEIIAMIKEIKKFLHRIFELKISILTENAPTVKIESNVKQLRLKKPEIMHSFAFSPLSYSHLHLKPSEETSSAPSAIFVGSSSMPSSKDSNEKVSNSVASNFFDYNNFSKKDFSPPSNSLVSSLNPQQNLNPANLNSFSLPVNSDKSKNSPLPSLSNRKRPPKFLESSIFKKAKSPEEKSFNNNQNDNNNNLQNNNKFINNQNESNNYTDNQNGNNFQINNQINNSTLLNILNDNSNLPINNFPNNSNSNSNNMQALNQNPSNNSIPKFQKTLFSSPNATPSLINPQSSVITSSMNSSLTNLQSSLNNLPSSTTLLSSKNSLSPEEELLPTVRASNYQKEEIEPKQIAKKLFPSNEIEEKKNNFVEPNSSNIPKKILSKSPPSNLQNNLQANFVLSLNPHSPHNSPAKSNSEKEISGNVVDPFTVSSQNESPPHISFQTTQISQVESPLKYVKPEILVANPEMYPLNHPIYLNSKIFAGLFKGVDCIDVSSSIALCDLFLTQWATCSNFSVGMLAQDPLKKRFVETLTEPMYFNVDRSCVLVALSITWDGKVVYYLPLQTEIVNNRIKFIKALMENEDSEKVCFGAKALLKVLLRNGMRVLGKIRDPGICSWLVNCDKNKDINLKKLASTYNLAEMVLRVSPKSEEKSACHCVLSFVCMQKLSEAMAREDDGDFKAIARVFYEIEMPLQPVLAFMEYCGVGFDENKLFESRQAVLDAIERIKLEVNKMIRGKVELNKNAQIAEVLYNNFKLPIPTVIEKGKTVKKRSTNKKTLLEFRTNFPQYQDFFDYILDYRTLSRIVDSQYNTLPNYTVFESQELKMHRIFPTILTTTAATGRIGCKDPNLQCINKTVDCRGVTINLRQAFVAANEHTLLSVDYQQLEIRVMSYACRSPKLREILSVEGADLFRKMASNWKNKPESEVTDEERTKIKQTVYGILYGMGPNTCAVRLGISINEARQLMEQFHKTFPEINQWMNEKKQWAQKQRCVYSLYGRKRPIAIDTEGRWQRQAVNTICQGTGADILKKAMIKIYGQLVKENLRSRIILPIHDELLLEVAHEEFEHVKNMVINVMESIFEIRLPVSWETGNSWGDLKEKEEELSEKPDFN